MKFRIAWILSVLITGVLLTMYCLSVRDAVHGWMAVAFFGIAVIGSGALFPARYS